MAVDLDFKHVAWIFDACDEKKSEKAFLMTSFRSWLIGELRAWRSSINGGEFCKPIFDAHNNRRVTTHDVIFHPIQGSGG